MRRLALAALISMAAQSCFFYDSRWGQAEAEQRRAAKRQAPVRLGKDPATGTTDLERRPASELRALRLRAYATPEHVAETIDWQRQLEQSLESVNAVLTELGVGLLLERSSVWRPAAGSGTLEETLEALRKFDPATDVDFVVALTGSLPRVEFSFHQLGMAGLLGKHLVVRAMNDAAEFKAMQRNLDELDEAERQKLYQDRKRHKNAAVLLHELAHALGAIHVNNPKELMNPRYSPEAADFGIETRALLKIALRYPEYNRDPRQQQAFIDESLTELKNRPSAAWVTGERERQIALLESHRTRMAQVAPAPALKLAPVAPPRSTARAAAAPASEPGPDVSADERGLFQKASEALSAGRRQEAWTIGEPLFEKYPADYAIQDLRCKIASRLSLPWEETRRACQPLMALTR